MCKFPLQLHHLCQRPIASLQHPQFELRFAVFIAPPVAPAIGCSGVDEGAAEDGLFGDRFVVAVLCEVVNQEDRYSKS